MKRVVLLAVLMLALPIMAFANSSLVFTNHGGNITYNGSNLTGGAVLDSFTSSGGTVGCGTTACNIGHVSYTTGAISGHSLTATTDSWTFAAGGSFKITSNGTVLLPAGTVFTGTFTGPVTFVGTFNPAGDRGAGAWTYTLSGSIAGMFTNAYGGATATGGTVQFTFDVHGHVPFTNSVRGKSGITTVSAVPEPGTLGLLGTGLVGIAGLVRRKFRSPV